MALDAQQVEALQNSVPTDWSKFDQTVSVDARTFGGAPGGLPPGMGPGHDDKLHVHFYMKPRIDIEESTKANRPIYKDVAFVTVMIPGDKNNIVTAEVWDLHRRRWPQHWAQFLAGVKDQVVGTPLKVAPFLTEAHIEELAYFKIRTIEQLANLSDTNMTFMGAREMSDAAKKYLLTVNGNEALMERIRALEAQIGNQKAEAAGQDASNGVGDEERAARSGGKPPVKNFGR